LVEVNLRS